MFHLSARLDICAHESVGLQKCDGVLLDATFPSRNPSLGVSQQRISGRNRRTPKLLDPRFSDSQSPRTPDSRTSRLRTPRLSDSQTPGLRDSRFRILSSRTPDPDSWIPDSQTPRRSIPRTPGLCTPRLPDSGIHRIPRQSASQPASLSMNQK